VKRIRNYVFTSKSVAANYFAHCARKLDPEDEDQSQGLCPLRKSNPGPW